MRKWWCLILLLPLLGGCAGRYCERNVQAYEGAVERAPLRSPEGLQVPEPDPNFMIPEATGEDVSYASPLAGDPTGRKADCLDTPPSIVPQPTVRDVEPFTEQESAGQPVEPEPAAGTNEPVDESTTADPAGD